MVGNISVQLRIFWEKLSLVVQVISYLQKHETKYIPIQKNPEILVWMRKFLKNNKGAEIHLEVNFTRN